MAGDTKPSSVKCPIGETKVLLNGEISSVDYECGQFLLDIPIAHEGQVKSTYVRTYIGLNLKYFNYKDNELPVHMNKENP